MVLIMISSSIIICSSSMMHSLLPHILLHYCKSPPPHNVTMFALKRKKKKHVHAPNQAPNAMVVSEESHVFNQGLGCWPCPTASTVGLYYRPWMAGVGDIWLL